jgi:hypothetical protein
MSVTVKVLIAPKSAESTQTTQYTANGVSAIIDKFTATNYDTVARTLSVNLVQSAGAAASDNLVVKTKTLQGGETYTFPEIVGHALDSGGFISTIASAATTITIRASGREVS